MFDIYEHEFELDGSKYRLVPVGGEHITLLFTIIAKLGDAGEIKASDLDQETMTAFRRLSFETFRASYPKQDVVLLDQFVSQNLMRLFEPVLAVNMKTPSLKQ